MNPKQKAVLDRIRFIEERIAKGRQYLETSQHARGYGFRPWFHRKMREGKELPPHPDWVKNVFIPPAERALHQAEKVLDRLATSPFPAQTRHARAAAPAPRRPSR